MSLEKKLRDAALAAAIEATTNERARCLWCIDEVLKELKAQVDQKLLTPIQTHAVELKLKIADGLASRVRRVIVSGARPVSETGQVRGVADLSSLGVDLAAKCPNCGERHDQKGCRDG